MHDPFDIGGYDPIPPRYEPDMELSFANTEGRGFTINLDQLVRAFLALETDGLIPALDADWCEGLSLLQAELGCGSQSSESLARFRGLMRPVDAICSCCGSEAHAVFTLGAADIEEVYCLERWSVVSSVMLTVERGALPELPFQWYISLERDYERIRETGRQIWARAKGGSGDV